LEVDDRHCHRTDGVCWHRGGLRDPRPRPPDDLAVRASIRGRQAMTPTPSPYPCNDYRPPLILR
jgi:hypothetical protein